MKIEKKTNLIDDFHKKIYIDKIEMKRKMCFFLIKIIIIFSINHMDRIFSIRKLCDLWTETFSQWNTRSKERKSINLFKSKKVHNQIM